MLATALTSFAELYDELKVFVRQSAWLNTVPEKATRSRRETRGATLPPLRAGEYLISILYEIGPVKSGAMSPVALDELDLAAWQANQGVALTPWEASTIRNLSREYAAMLSQASDANCPQPWFSPEEITAEKRSKIAQAMSAWSDKLNSARNR